MINGISLAMVAGVGLRTLAGVIQAYPTFSTQAGAIRKATQAYTRTRRTSPVTWLLAKWLGRLCFRR